MVCVVGMGPGDLKHLTLYAYEKLQKSPCLIAFGRISKTAEALGKEVIKVKSVDEILACIKDNSDVTILASGDPCFYGIVEYLKNNGIEINEIIPGVSSFQYMMTRLKKSWNDAALISFHGRDKGFNQVFKSKISIMLTDSKHTPDFISKFLYDMGLRGRIYAGFDLSYPEENIVVKNIGEDFEYSSSLSLVVVENEMD